MTKVGTLDGLRGIAVSLVMLLHFGYLNGGWIGVQVFFVLSGYLITRILVEDRAAPLGDYARRFYWRRALRIFPLYYLYLALVAAVFLASGRPVGLPAALPSLATYTFNFTRWSPDWQASPFFTHFWSLAVEEQFYLVWPFVVHALSPRALVRVAAALVAAGPAVRWAVGALATSPARTPYDVGDTVYWFPLTHADAFATGALLAVLPAAERIRRPAAVVAAALAAVALGGAFHLRALHQSGIELPMGTMGFPLAGIAHGQHVWSYSLLNLASGACIAAAVAAHREGGPLRTLLANPVLTALGRISYGVYVLHWPLLAVFNAYVRYRPLTPRGYRMFALWVLLVWAAAALVYRLWESRFLALKDVVAPRTGRPAEDSAA